MENSLAHAPDELAPLEPTEPGRMEISRQQQERLRVGGCDVVANGTIQFLEGTTVAIVPFPKSKTGFTVEIHMAPTPDGKPSYRHAPNDVTRTYRQHFFGYDEFTMQPFGVAMYRGKIVMGILRAKVILARPRIWSLGYTLYYAPKPPRRGARPAA